jgi:hypothetical protein
MWMPEYKFASVSPGVGRADTSRLTHGSGGLTCGRALLDKFLKSGLDRITYFG